MKALILAAILLMQGLPAQPIQNGVVMGQVRGPDGTAAAGVRIAAMRALDSGGLADGSVLAVLAEADIEGRYRLENVSPGKYYIMAGPLGSPTYYPGVKALADGRIVTVATGSTVVTIDFTLLSPPIPSGFKISGNVVIVPGQLMPRRIRLRSMQEDPNGGRETAINPDGTFQFLGAIPPEYDLNVVLDSALTAGRNFTFGARDVSGIQVKVPIEARGRVVMADGTPVPSPPIRIQNVTSAGNLGGAGGALTLQRLYDVQRDGGFVVRVVAGEQRISVFDLPASYSVKSITYGSADILDNPLKLDGPLTSEIQVTLEPLHR